MERTPTSLKELARLVLDVQGTSARQAAQQAKAAGLKLTYTTLNERRAGTCKFVPGEDTVRALARLAKVTDGVAFGAAGLPVPGPPLADELPPGSDNLSLKSRAAVVQMLRVLVDLDSNHDANHPDHNKHPHDDTPERSASRREPRATAAGGGGAGGRDPRAGQETAAAEHDGVRPEELVLAAHPDLELTRGRQDREWGDVGEENQDAGGEGL